VGPSSDGYVSITPLRLDLTDEKDPRAHAGAAAAWTTRRAARKVG
jgi:hypothetical protein